MKVPAILATSLFVGLTQVAVAETKFPDDMKMADAIKNVISQVNKSDYKEIEVITTNGTVSGEFVKQSGDVLILKRMSGNINLKHNKERVQYTIVNIRDVIGVSFSTLD